MKLISWNVNGWRAILRKNALKAALDLGGDVYCFQETKASEPEIDLDLASRFEVESRSGEKKGYSGTMNLVDRNWLKKNDWQAEFLKNEDLWQSEKLQAEGRICAAALKPKKGAPLLLLNVYFPNGGMSDERLQYKMDFYEDFLKEVGRENKSDHWQGIIICGDVNTAHNEIDLARPKENSKNTGFLPMERDWVSRFLASGFIDTYRAINPEKIEYSWWDYKTRARERNVGWRIDYFMISESLRSKIKSVGIAGEIMGSDHAPIWLELNCV